MADLGHSPLNVATYAEPRVALRDFRSLEALVADEGIEVLGAVVMSRHDDGKVDVLAATEEAGEEEPDWFRGSTGIVVGLFAPELLLALVDGREGSALSSLIRVHDEGRVGVDLDQSFPPESAVVVLVVAHTDVRTVDGALLRARAVACREVEGEHCLLLRDVLDGGGKTANT